jgi:hypothetical protein
MSLFAFEITCVLISPPQRSLQVSQVWDRC